MWNIISLLKNKWVWIGIIGIVLGAYIGFLKLSYSNLELSHQKVESELVATSEKLTQYLSELKQQKAEVERLVSTSKVSEKVSGDVAQKLQSLQSENSLLKQTINKLKKEDTYVEEYLNTTIPDSIIERLRLGK